MSFSPSIKLKHKIFKQIHCFYCFNEISTIKKPKIITFSITGSQLFFADYIISARTKEKLKTVEPLISLKDVYECIFNGKLFTISLDHSSLFP